MSKEKLIINHGPQFYGTISNLGLFGLIGCAIAGTLSFQGNDLFSACSYVGGAFLCFGLFLDIRGVMIDFKNKRLMEYQKLWGIKKGRWEYIEHFNEIVLTYERVSSVNSTSIMTSSRRGQASYSFCLVLKSKHDEIEVENFEIAEYSRHRAGRAALLSISKKLNLPYSDEFFTLSAKAQKRRKELEKRRRSGSNR